MTQEIDRIPKAATQRILHRIGLLDLSNRHLLHPKCSEYTVGIGRVKKADFAMF